MRILLPLIVVASCSACFRHTPETYRPQASGSGGAQSAQQLLQRAGEFSRQGPAGPDLPKATQALDQLLSEHPHHPEALWRSAQVYYWRTQKQSPETEALASRCMAVAAQATAVKDPSAWAHLYSALCMGSRARSVYSEALGLIPRMLKEAQLAYQKDKQVDSAGPARLLGGIYLRAPAWPASVGDLDEALEYLAEACRLSPHWAENHLLLAEALYEDEQLDAAKDSLKRAKEILSAGKQPHWQALWQKQLRTLDEKLSL